MRCAQMIKSFLEVMHHFEEGFDHCGGISFWGHTMRAFKNTPTNFWRIFPHSVWWKACVSLLWFWSFLHILAFFNCIFAPQAVVISSLEPLKSSWRKLFNGTRLDIGSARGAEIFFFYFWKNNAEKMRFFGFPENAPQLRRWVPEFSDEKSAFKCALADGRKIFSKNFSAF